MSAAIKVRACDSSMRRNSRLKPRTPASDPTPTATASTTNPKRAEASRASRHAIFTAVDHGNRLKVLIRDVAQRLVPAGSRLLCAVLLAQTHEDRDESLPMSSADSDSPGKIDRSELSERRPDAEERTQHMNWGSLRFLCDSASLRRAQLVDLSNVRDPREKICTLDFASSSVAVARKHMQLEERRRPGNGGNVSSDFC